MKCICENLQKTSFYKSVLSEIKSNTGMTRLGRMAEGLLPHFLHTLFTDLNRTVFYVFPNDYEAKRAFDESYYAEKLYLPAPETELSQIDARSMELSHGRTTALCTLLKKNCVVYASQEALLYKMRQKQSFVSGIFKIKEGMIIDKAELQRKFVENGYEYSPLIEGRGQFSGRGEIAEIYTPSGTAPYRITFFDDEVEQIRLFDTETQRSYGEKIEEIEITPAMEMNLSLSADAKQKLIDYLSSFEDAERKNNAERLIFELNDTGSFSNIEAFSDIFDDKCSILDWVDEPVIVFNDLFKLMSENASRMKTSEVLFQEVMNNGGAFGCENSTLFDAEEFIASKTRKIDICGIVEEKIIKVDKSITADVSSAVGFEGNMDMLCDALKERIQAGYDLFLFASSGARNTAELLKERGITAPITDGICQKGTSIVNGRIKSGFILNDIKACYLSEEDIFGKRFKATKKRQKKKAVLNPEIDLKPGDTVVHELYGKGRYLGIKNMEAGGTRGDYLEIEYRDGDKLYIKTSQMDRISRFIGSDDDAKHLSKLGGREWENAKQRARSAVKQLTEDLVSIYEERAKIEGYRFSPDTPWQNQFEDNFEFEETDGQIESTEQIKRDMESTKVMDRLLLGDVGYGKTEVAMRAAFKAVMDSKQVAMLVPTTLLARQHYESFLDRFSGFPVKIAMLSRFTKNPSKVIAEVNSGAVDILIGTHKLLSKSIQYKDLGLLIVDEEQRFGVSHKERIKDMKRTVDVLTLTATPIPRTLEMAMTGIRDISTIDTPPEDRKEVVSYVAEFSWQIVREAIVRELSRGGQTFFVCRKISEMDELLRSIHAHVPEARVAIAHGQMNEETFESVISSFIDKQFDVLLCTTIIESGIDIPNANTIIVYEADMYGLAQLYQLKGRVGRSHQRAYAYFTHIRTDSMTEIAQKRLAAIREFTQFGSGYKIAMRDLEIRGAGNILGAEQSGHMAQIGYDLYCKIVRQEVDNLMGRPEPVSLDTEVDLGMDAFIPDSYIPDETQKLEAYRMAQNVKSIRDVSDLKEHFIERYGELPKVVENLLAYRLIRSVAEQAGFQSVIKQPKFIELKFAENVYVDEARAMSIIAQQGDFAMYRRSNPPAVILKQKKGMINDMLRLLNQLKRCIKVVHKV